jgi:hypothetical protein
MLAKALGRVIDPGRFESLPGATYLPFPIGPNKSVVIKVIDPCSNEVMSAHKL